MGYNFEEAYEHLEQNSVNRNEVEATQRKVAYKKKKKRYRLANPKKFFIALFLSLALIVGGKLAYSEISPYFDGSYVNQSFTVGRDSIGQSTHRTSDNQGYWYDVDAISKLYDASNMDFDSFVYGAYTGMNMRVLPNMDDLFWQFKMRGITDYNKFTEYVKGSGYVEVVDGEEVADIEKWKDAMKKHIRVGNELNDIYSQVGHYEPYVFFNNFEDGKLTDYENVLIANGITDLDIYINKIYDQVGWNKESRLLCMNDLMEDLYNSGYTPYSSFFDYCLDKGFVKEERGEMVVDTAAYEKAYKTYLDRIEKICEYMSDVKSFTSTRTSNERTEGLGK